MTTAESLADDVLGFLCRRVNVTTGTRQDIKRFIVDRVRQYVPSAQMSMEDITANRHGGNRQSEQAADQHKARRASQRQRIWTFLHERGPHGATVEEISQALCIRYTTSSARCSEMKRDSLIRDSGQTRLTDTSSDAAVLVIL